MTRTIADLPQSLEIEHEQVALGFALLNDADVAAQTDENSFKRGKTYFRGNRIFNGTRRADVLRARCYGSSGGPYVVEATLAPAEKLTARNPKSYACDCPRGGFCKHVVALLLTWIDDPHRIEVRPPIAELLAGKSRDELVALIELMLRENPDLEETLALPVPAGGGPSDEPVDETLIRRQIAAALADTGGHDRYRYDYDDDWAGSRVAASWSG